MLVMIVILYSDCPWHTFEWKAHGCWRNRCPVDKELSLSVLDVLLLHLPDPQKHGVASDCKGLEAEAPNVAVTAED